MANYYVISIKFHWGFSYVLHGAFFTGYQEGNIIDNHFFVTRIKQPTTIATNRICISRDNNILGDPGAVSGGGKKSKRARKKFGLLT